MDSKDALNEVTTKTRNQGLSRLDGEDKVLWGWLSSSGSRVMGARSLGTIPENMLQQSATTPDWWEPSRSIPSRALKQLGLCRLHDL